MPRRKPLAEVTARILQDSDLSSSAKLIYLFIASEYRLRYINPIDYLSCDRIAEAVNYRASTVRKGLRRLKEVGLIDYGPGYADRVSINLLHLDNDHNLLRQLASSGGQ